MVDIRKIREEIEADPYKYLVATIGWGAACVAGVAASAALWEVPIVNIFVIGATVFACASAYNSASAADSSASSTNGKKVTLREAYARTAAGDSSHWGHGCRRWRLPEDWKHACRGIEGYCCYPGRVRPSS